MATLMIYDPDDDLVHRLAIRAATMNRSIEEEARPILKAALLDPAQPADLFGKLRSATTEVGFVELPTVSRAAGRVPSDFSAPDFRLHVSRRPAAQRR